MSESQTPPTQGDAPAYNPLAASERLASKYELSERLGAGGLGCVYAARHIGFDSRVALKFLHPEYARDPELLACFKREARAGFQIDNKHVVRVIDFEELADGTPFIVMEHLRGMDLAQLLDRRGKLPSQRACQYVLQVCAGLRAAHVIGVIHRDIKPGNLFLVSADAERKQDEHIKLLDFGISKLCTGTHVMQTAGAVSHSQLFTLGTPHYMSPEQVRGAADLDTRTDIWSLGCVLYELLTGVAPFRRASIAQTCAAVLEDAPLTPHALDPEIPAGLVALVLRCLARDPKQRPQTVDALAEAIVPYTATVRLARQLTAAVPSEPRLRTQRARLNAWACAATGLFVVAMTSAWWATPARTPRLIAQAKAPPSASQTLAVQAPGQDDPGAPALAIDVVQGLQAPALPVRNHGDRASKPRRREPPAPQTVDSPLTASEPDVGF